MNFADLGLSESVLRAVTDAGYEIPTPIQERGIPYVFMKPRCSGLRANWNRENCVVHAADDRHSLAWPRSCANATFAYS